MLLHKIGFGGGCHWCTEAVFQSLVGVQEVGQGWISAVAPDDSFSEAVMVYFDPQLISQHTLVEIHLLTHASTANHSMRSKYRSAVYVFDDEQSAAATDSLNQLQANFHQPLVTRVLHFAAFRKNTEQFLDYYRKNPEKAFCKRYIHPKLQALRKHHGNLLAVQVPA